jgi:hypothetical protein
MGKRTEQSFFKGRSTNDQKTHEKYLTSLAIKELKIKTTLRFPLIPVRMVMIKNTTKMLVRI